MGSARLKRSVPPGAAISQVRAKRFTQAATSLSRAEVSALAERFGLTHDRIARLELHEVEGGGELRVAAPVAGRDTNAIIDFLTFLVRTGIALPGSPQEPFEDP